MSIQQPPADWCKAPTGFERTWIGIALVWCLVMFLMMPLWHLRGKQNSTGEAYRVMPVQFLERVEKFVQSNKVAEDRGVPVVQPAPGGDAYLLARMWNFYPVLKLKKDQTYRLHVSSLDLQHGLSLQPMNMNFQILPGYDHVLTITPTAAGDYLLICNEFCGLGHHTMTGKITVEE
jgi:cytochrome c oxidase subunit 2